MPTIKNVMSPRPSLAEDTKAVADGDLTADGYLKKPSWHRDVDIPSGKHTETYRKSWRITILKFGKSTISMGHGFNSKVLNDQKVSTLCVTC